MVVDIVLLVGVVLGFGLGIGGLVFLAMQFEQRRLRAGVAAFAASIDQARVETQRGPGAWRLPTVDGKYRGCTITLRPTTTGATRAPGGPRLAMLAVELVVRGPARPGTGEIAARNGSLELRGDVVPPRDSDALQRALVACSAITIREGEARATLALPSSSRAGERAALLAKTIASYLTEETA